MQIRFANIWVLLLAAAFLAVVAISFLSDSSNNFDLPKHVDFNYHVRPIISQNCYVCHGPDSSTREAGLRLDVFDGATSELEHGGAAIVPGSARKSLLLDRISSTDADFRMPPPEAKTILSPREIALLEKWIRQGAEWKPHWSFIKPQMPDLSSYLGAKTTTNVIDFLIGESLKANRLSVSVPAGKRKLIRRVSFLLTGLPPTPADAEEFVTDSSAQAYEKMIERYLASPQFGERWARHWMDLVRYGEHMGHEFDYTISGAWQYRDYLIRAFNLDVPYNLFVKEHLAGDMLDNPRYHPETGSNESIIGTGYFFLGEGKHSPVSIKQEEADRIDNMIDVTSKTFQGLTVACARCHDHKFDPIPTTDYYAMYGMLESARLGPLPARQTIQQEEARREMRDIKMEVRAELGTRMQTVLEEGTASFISLEKQPSNGEETLGNRSNEDSLRMIGDFRSGHWDGWYADGWSFGERPFLSEPVIDKTSGRVMNFEGGFASSRSISRGVMGALRSPNFIVEHKFIVVRAKGANSMIRLIVDNFQVVQDPLYGTLQVIVDGENWKTYILDVSMVRGHKAYLQFTPGHYGIIPRSPSDHDFRISSEDYIDVAYALASDQREPDVLLLGNKDTPKDEVDKKLAIADWINAQADHHQVQSLSKEFRNLIGSPLSKDLIDRLLTYDKLAEVLYDSAHFIGMTEGDSVLSSVFVRGSINQQSNDRIPHQFLSAVSAHHDSFPQHGSGRLAWAEAVVDHENPLSARVFVNRIWHHLFGKGIVETVDNFGLQGQLPTHPELLDYLALQFMDEGWSAKRLIKNILMTEVFQRSTIVLKDNQGRDPTNQFLHHFPVRRIEAEAIRDAILSVAECLDLTMYGEPIPIHLTEFMTGRGRPRESGPLDGFGRRSIYMSVRRNFLQPMMLVFDAPIPFSTFGKRNVTNVPAQSLTLMNDPFVHEQANYWAESLVEKDLESLDDRIQEIYTRAFTRPADADELANAKIVLGDLAEQYGQSLDAMKDNPQLWTDYCHTIFNLKEFIHLL